MSIADIVVYLDPGAQTEGRVDAAVRLAADHGARLTAVDLCAAVTYDGSWERRQADSRARFEQAAASAGIDWTYRAADTNAASAQDFLAHAADLLVATQPSARHAAEVPTEFAERLLLHAGVPMLLLPPDWDGARPFGRRPLVAWNGTGEATRAVRDALPMLRRAERVSLFSFDAHYELRDAAIQDFAAHLRRHGVPVFVEGWRDTGEIDWFSALFSVLDREDSDLIVAGAYGHSRIMERLFGGATQDLLGETLVPLLVSH